MDLLAALVGELLCEGTQKEMEQFSGAMAELNANIDEGNADELALTITAIIASGLNYPHMLTQLSKARSQTREQLVGQIENCLTGGCEHAPSREPATSEKAMILA